MLQGGGGPDVAFRAYLLTAVRRLHVDRVRAGQRLHDHRRHDAVRPGRAVPGHRGRRLRERRGGEGVRLAARAVAAGAVAPRGRGPEARRHRPAARDERQLGVRAGLPRPRGAPPGVLDHAHLADITETDCRWVNEHLGAYIRNGPVQAGRRQGAGAPRRVPPLHRDVPRAHRGQLRTWPASSRPLLLGAAATGYLASSGAGAAGVLGLLSRAKDLVAANTGAVTAAGVASASPPPRWPR